MKRVERKGLEKGLEQGLEKGLAQGEKKKAIEIAKISLSQNLDIDTIIKITGLTEKEIKYDRLS